MKIKLGAVIPTVQYGNLQPEFELEVTEDNVVLGMATLEASIQELWDKYGEKPLVTRTAPTNRQLLHAFCGGDIYYDDTAHSYTNEAGEVYLSGSVYAATFKEPFDAKAIANKMATKYGASSDDIRAMWELKARTSREFGTALHSALELYGRFTSLALALERETHLHDHPVLKKAVEGFYGGRQDEKAIYEALIVDHDHKRAGQVDRLLVTKRKTCRIQDYKTNATISKDLDTYAHQLSFYADIMEHNGWAVEGLDLFHWDGEWHDYKLERKTTL